MNAQGDLACLDAGTGARLWSVNVLERYGGSNITWGMSESVLVRAKPRFPRHPPVRRG
jgi:hypothetical protein